MRADVALITGFSTGLGGGGAAGAECAWGPGAAINCLIRSTIPGSRLASALPLTGSSHSWMRSSSSWLFKPSSFASSWTRVDNGNSSWVGRRHFRPARLIGIGQAFLFPDLIEP